MPAAPADQDTDQKQTETPPAPPAASPTPPTTPPAPSAAPPPGSDDQVLAAAAKERDDARRELGTVRKELERLQKAEQEREDADKSELQKALDRIAEAERRDADKTRGYQDMAVQLTAQTEAIRLGFRRPERAHREIDLAAVTFDEGGQPTNLKALLEAELVERPELKASAPPPPDAGGGGRGKTQLTRAEIAERARQDPEWVNQHWDEVKDVLSQPGR